MLTVNESKCKQKIWPLNKKWLTKGRTSSISLRKKLSLFVLHCCLKKTMMDIKREVLPFLTTSSAFVVLESHKLLFFLLVGNFLEFVWHFAMMFYVWISFGSLVDYCEFLVFLRNFCGLNLGLIWFSCVFLCFLVDFIWGSCKFLVFFCTLLWVSTLLWLHRAKSLRDRQNGNLIKL